MGGVRHTFVPERQQHLMTSTFKCAVDLKKKCECGRLVGRVHNHLRANGSRWAFFNFLSESKNVHIRFTALVTVASV